MHSVPSEHRGKGIVLHEMAFMMNDTCGYEKA